MVEVRVLMAFFMLVLAVAAPVVAAGESADPAITRIGGTVQGREARVHFLLENAFSPEMVEALKSGIEISFRIRIAVERVHRNWIDETVGEMKYTHSIRYDVLSRVYRLHHPGGDEILPDIRLALARMTRFEVTVPLSVEAERGKPYRAAVKARIDRAGLSEPLRSIVFFSSMWDVETRWARGPVEAP